MSSWSNRRKGKTKEVVLDDEILCIQLITLNNANSFLSCVCVSDAMTLLGVWELQKARPTPLLQTNDPKNVPGCIYKSHLWDVTQSTYVFVYEKYRKKWWRQIKKCCQQFFRWMKNYKSVVESLSSSFLLLTQHTLRDACDDDDYVWWWLVGGVMQNYMFHSSHFHEVHFCGWRHRE